jgi:hypothetical protein
MTVRKIINKFDKDRRWTLANPGAFNLAPLGAEGGRDPWLAPNGGPQCRRGGACTFIEKIPLSRRLRRHLLYLDNSRVQALNLEDKQHNKHHKIPYAKHKQPHLPPAPQPANQQPHDLARLQRVIPAVDA